MASVFCRGAFTGEGAVEGSRMGAWETFGIGFFMENRKPVNIT